jgi:dUTP pyrophosphatase
MDGTLRIKKLRDDATMPTRQFDGDAGLDLYAAEPVALAPGERAKIPTGIALAVPKGLVGLIWDKSGLSNNHGLKTLGGVVDAGYRGEIMVGLINLSQESYTVEKGHRVAQMLLQKIERVSIEVTDNLDETDRGNGAFGSSGK